METLVTRVEATTQVTEFLIIICVIISLVEINNYCAYDILVV